MKLLFATSVLLTAVSVADEPSALTTSSVAAGSERAAAENQKLARPTREASASSEEVLKRFVQECVTITPGQKGFPQSALIGTDNPLPFERSRTEVPLEKSFRISRFEVTQELYSLVSGRNPSRWKGPRNSAEMMSWHEAVRFTEELTKRLRKRGLIAADEVVRLPNSVEWEYCCRAGSKSRYCFGDDVRSKDADTGQLDQYAWHTGNAAGNDPAVGVLKPNAWGLYDVHGYLWEFVSDQPASKTLDDGDLCQIRGGSWRDRHPLLSCSSRRTVSKDVRTDAVGIRCVIARHDAGKKTATK